MLIQRKAPIAGEAYFFHGYWYDYVLSLMENCDEPRAKTESFDAVDIGIVVILAAVAYIGYQMISLGCSAPLTVQLLVLTVIPVVYLTLMYLTLVSQE